MLISKKSGNRHIQKLKVGDYEIERVKTTRFLGIVIDDKFIWDEHIKHCKKKIVSGIYALNMVKNTLSTHLLRTLYFTLVHPHLNYGCVLWGSTYKKHLNTLSILQKKAIRIVCHSKYNATTSPLFKKVKIAKFEDIYNIEVNQLMFKVSNKSLPKPLLKYFVTNATIHYHNTRHKHDFRINPAQNKKAYTSLLYAGPRLWSILPEHLKVNRTLKTLKNNIKQYYLSKY